ncbi:MAG: TIGR02466 family protein [Hyphomicrobiaceae bacterium]
MTDSQIYFGTRIHRTLVKGKGAALLRADLATACRSIAHEDKAGRSWSKAHGYAGYTSYASLNDLSWRIPAFEDLGRILDREARGFARALDLELAGRPLVLDSLWINVLDRGGVHSGHIHPNCVISGTYYVEAPDGAGAIRFEDPRLPLMMAAPQRKARARPDNRSFVEIAPRPGMLLMWESWLRHEVLPNRASDSRISVSFNYRWG